MRVGARLLAASIGAGLVVALGCTETRRGLGDACLKGDDCLSGVCSGQVCVGAPPVASGAATAPVPDASGEDDVFVAPTDAGDAAESTDAAGDAKAIADAGDAG